MTTILDGYTVKYNKNNSHKPLIFFAVKMCSGIMVLQKFGHQNNR